MRGLCYTLFCPHQPLPRHPADPDPTQKPALSLGRFYMAKKLKLWPWIFFVALYFFTHTLTQLELHKPFKNMRTFDYMTSKKKKTKHNRAALITAVM